MPPIAAAGCRSVTLLTGASGCPGRRRAVLRPTGHAGPGIGRRHLAWRPRHALPAVRPVAVREPGLAGHPNCRDNFLAAAASAGIVLPVVPDPVNLFQDS